MKVEPPTPGKRTGRPLSFDREGALHEAMLLFWRHGYEATSLAELTRAMNITPPSLYAAFGDKKTLFLEAVQRYLSGPITSESIIAEAQSARAAANELLRQSAIGFTGENTPPGCLLATSAISCSPEATAVQGALSEIRRRIEFQLKRKIVLDLQSGQMPAGLDADTLAGHVMSVIQGMSTLARDGAKRSKLLRVADFAMLAWPLASKTARTES